MHSDYHIVDRSYISKLLESFALTLIQTRLINHSRWQNILLKNSFEFYSQTIASLYIELIQDVGSGGNRDAPENEHPPPAGDP